MGNRRYGGQVAADTDLTEEGGAAGEGEGGGIFQGRAYPFSAVSYKLLVCLSLTCSLSFVIKEPTQ
ncbi:hypothetical protein PFUM301597_39990 [Pseudomonas fluorescens]